MFEPPPRILFPCAEFFPVAKTGGLADACAGLAAALADSGLDVRLLLPGYPAVLAAAPGAREVRALADGGRVLLGHLAGTGLPLYVFDHPALFDRAGGPYQDTARRDWPDNHIRFAAFSRAAAQLARDGDVAGWAPDLVHVHDWHTALVPALLDAAAEPHPPCMLTIHNLAYQGNFPLAAAAEAGLPDALAGTEGAEFFGRFSFLKAGLRYADRLTTVSPSYAREILTPAHGAGMDGVLRTRVADLFGILNGVDTAIWNPAIDTHLCHAYSARDPGGKAACKSALQMELGLEADPDIPLVVFVNRLTHQKMADVVLQILPALAERDVQFVLHGEGEPALEAAFAAYDGSSARTSIRVGYEEALAHRLFAGADISLVPSRFEPCGLTAMYSMLYGALPVCRAVGGLLDTIVDAGSPSSPLRGANGFSFVEDNATDLLAGIDRACAVFAREPNWRDMQRNAMSRDFSWATAARKYRDLYAALRPDLDFTRPAAVRCAA